MPLNVSNTLEFTTKPSITENQNENCLVGASTGPAYTFLIRKTRQKYCRNKFLHLAPSKMLIPAYATSLDDHIMFRYCKWLLTTGPLLRSCYQLHQLTITQHCTHFITISCLFSFEYDQPNIFLRKKTISLYMPHVCTSQLSYIFAFSSETWQSVMKHSYANNDFWYPS